MISRRNFLKESLAVVSLGLGVPSVFGKAAVAAAAENSAGVGRTLIVVQLAGGVDGLNTVIPYTDPAYRRARPGIAIPRNEMLTLGDQFAFHPSLAQMKEVWDEGRLAVVQGVGYPNPDLSHFKSMDIWQSANPDGVSREGWLGRYFDEVTDAEGHPLAGLSIGRSLPSAFKTPRAPIPSMESLEAFGLRPAFGDKEPLRREASLVRLYDIYQPSNTPFAALLDTTLDDALGSATTLKTAHEVYQPSVTYPESSLASGLQLLAELIDSGEGVSPLRVGHVTLGGFDTHTQEPGNLANLLREASEAITAFWRDIVAHGHGDNVMVMTWSEFGRRVAENAQAGTDHGAAGVMFLLGGGIKGGLYGDPPSLTDLDNGNLRYTVDFRSVYATVLERWLQAPADAILGQRFDQLNLLAS
jgi:uncharacterized protein (DUF1501 family)